jgi:hypothetical protein
MAVRAAGDRGASSAKTEPVIRSKQKTEGRTKFFLFSVGESLLDKTFLIVI